MPSRRSLLIAAAAFAGGTTLGILALREDTAPLTRDLLDAAEMRWRSGGVQDYSMRFRMNRDVYFVRCRDGVVYDLSVNERDAGAADYGLYSAQGLFKVLGMDLDLADDPYGPFGGAYMRVRFDPELGFVQYYVRSSGSAGSGAMIEMLEFRLAGNSD